MQKKIAELEKLIYQVCYKINLLKEENRSLTAKLKIINGKFSELAKDREKLHKLINWKTRTHAKLSKLKDKIDFVIKNSNAK